METNLEIPCRKNGSAGVHRLVLTFFVLWLLVLAAAVMVRPALSGSTQGVPSSGVPVVRAGAAGSGLLLGGVLGGAQDELQVPVDLSAFSPRRVVFLLTFPEVQGEALCLTQNLKQCEQLLSLRSGQQSAVHVYLPKNSELFGFFRHGAQGNFMDEDIRRAAFNQELEALGALGEALLQHAGRGEAGNLQAAEVVAVLNLALDWQELPGLAAELDDPALAAVLHEAPSGSVGPSGELRSLNRRLLLQLFPRGLRAGPQQDGWYYSALD